MPPLIAAGVAGWFLALRRARRPGGRALPRCRHGTRTDRNLASRARRPQRRRRDRGARLRRVWLGGSPSLEQARAVRRGRQHAAGHHRHPQRLAARPAPTSPAATPSSRATSRTASCSASAIGHPEATSDYTRPLKTMREFFDGLDAPSPVPKDSAWPPRWARRCSTWPTSARSAPTRTSSTPEHTRFARERLGAGRARRARGRRRRRDATPRPPAGARASTRSSTSGCATTRATCSSSATRSATSPTAAATA